MEQQETAARREKGAYTTATDQLNRALALAPDDKLALWLTARVNLCDCVDAWSHNVEEQQAIKAAAAIEKYLRHDPNSASMLTLKSQLYELHGKFEESLLIVDSVLKRDPEHTEALGLKAYDLLKLGRPQEALSAVDEVLVAGIGGSNCVGSGGSLRARTVRAGGADGTKGHDADGPRRVEQSQMGRRRPDVGRLGGPLGGTSRAKAALAEFNAAVPGVQTISAI